LDLSNPIRTKVASFVISNHSALIPFPDERVKAAPKSGMEAGKSTDSLPGTLLQRSVGQMHRAGSAGFHISRFLRSVAGCGMYHPAETDLHGGKSPAETDRSIAPANAIQSDIEMKVRGPMILKFKTAAAALMAVALVATAAHASDPTPTVKKHVATKKAANKPAGPTVEEQIETPGTGQPGNRDRKSQEQPVRQGCAFEAGGASRGGR
jgi:hypothetical protein